MIAEPQLASPTAGPRDADPNCQHLVRWQRAPYEKFGQPTMAAQGSSPNIGVAARQRNKHLPAAPLWPASAAASRAGEGPP
ncbi:MAG: hypothetical protein AAF580_15715, partial [Pseudomonadota bacterium]